MIAVARHLECSGRLRVGRRAVLGNVNAIRLGHVGVAGHVERAGAAAAAEVAIFAITALALEAIRDREGGGRWASR